MKRIYMGVLLLLCGSYISCNQDDRLVESIEDSDPEGLRDLLIPEQML